MKKPIIIFSAMLSASSTIVRADHPTVVFGSESAGPINTLSATAVPEGSLGLGVRTEIINNDAFSLQQLEDFAVAGLVGVHSVDKITNTSVALSYGASDSLSFSIRLPYIERKNIRESEIGAGVPEAHTHGDSSGFGDLLLFGQYKLPNFYTHDVSIQFGIKAPTGETDVKDLAGIDFETEFQPGSDSWDYLLGAAVSRKHNNFSFHVNALYNMTTEGSQSTEIGDSFTYNAAAVYRLESGSEYSQIAHDHSSHDHSDENSNVKWDVMIELNGESRMKNEISGIKDENSGGSVLLVSPGLRVTAGKFGGFISVGFPVIENQNGQQTDIETRIVAGLSFAI